MKKIVNFIIICFYASVINAELVKDKNDMTINEMDLQVLLETAPVEAQEALLNNKKRLKKQLEQLYLTKEMARMAEKQGLDQEPLNKARIQAIVDHALYQLQLNEVKKSIEKDYSKYARKLYEINKSEYRQDQRVNAAHILVSTKKISEQQALTKAQEIRKELVAGANFSELALLKSDDKSVKKNQGELGEFSKDEMAKPFSDAVFSMQTGELSQPIKTRFGYHLIKLNQKLPASIKPFEQVKQGIINGLREKDWETERMEYYENITKGNEMEIDDTVLDEYIAKKLADLKSQK